MRYSFFILLIGVLIQQACTSSSGSERRVGNSKFHLDTISPGIGIPGTEVVLYGQGLPDKDLKVWFGDVEADSIVIASHSSIKVIVPAELERKALQVHVSSKDDQLYSNSIPFVGVSSPKNVRPIFFTTGKISTAEISEDGKLRIQELFEDSHPRGLKIDHATNHVYWGNFYGFLQRFNLETMSREIIMVAEPGDELLDLAWSDDFSKAYIGKDDRIVVKDLSDTSKVAQVLCSNRAEPFGITLSSDGEKLYWVEWASLSIYMMPVTGGVPSLFIDGPQLDILGPRAFVLDEKNDRMYIANTPKVGGAEILLYDMQKKEIKRLIGTEEGAGTLITDLIVDDQNGYLYWMNSNGKNKHRVDEGMILRAPLNDFSKPEIVVQPINWGHLLAF